MPRAEQKVSLQKGKRHELIKPIFIERPWKKGIFGLGFFLPLFSFGDKLYAPAAAIPSVFKRKLKEREFEKTPPVSNKQSEEPRVVPIQLLQTFRHIQKKLKLVYFSIQFK